MYANSGARERAFNLRNLFRWSTAQNTSARVGTHFQAFMNLSDVFFFRCFSEASKKHFRRNFRKCSRMKPNVSTSMLDGGDGVIFSILLPPNTASRVDAKELDFGLI